MTKQFHVYTHENEIATVVKCHFSSKHLQAANWSYKKHASEANGRTNRAAQTYPHAHVERDDGDTDVLRGFSVHIRELQPGVVLLLPRTQSIPCYKRWDCGEKRVRLHRERQHCSWSALPSKQFLSHS